MRAFVRRLERRIDAKVALAERLLARDAWDLAVIGFAEAHCVGHPLWHVHAAGHARHDRGLRRDVGDLIRAVYERLDGAIGRLPARVGPSTRVLVLASHGMGPHHDGSHLLDRFLVRLEPSLPGVRPLGMRERMMRLRAGGDRAKGGFHALWRRWPRRRFRAVFAVSNNEAWGAVRVNRIGRERHGRVAAGDFDAVLERVADALRSARNPLSGTPAFARVLRTSDLF